MILIHRTFIFLLSFSKGPYSRDILSNIIVSCQNRTDCPINITGRILRSLWHLYCTFPSLSYQVLETIGVPLLFLKSLDTTAAICNSLQLQEASDMQSVGSVLLHFDLTKQEIFLVIFMFEIIYTGLIMRSGV